MSVTFLVDAHNALFRLWAEPPENAETARRLVVDRAKEALRRRGVAGAVAHLVFDTTPAGRQRAGTFGRDGAVTWSYADGSADEEIVRLVRENDAQDGGRRIAVVSDDRELRGRASQLSAEVLRVHDWFEAKDVEAEREASKAGPPMSAADFGMTEGAIDLDGDPDDL
jgi:hypothetical protein